MSYCPHCLPPTSGGQAGNNRTRQTHKQSTKFKEEATICCKEKKITSPPNECCVFPPAFGCCAHPKAGYLLLTC